ncbi:amidase family protein [Robertkochia solimangrovi]|uniref:amidase family protein n=1 Tax=Robertkochia solimangrovi TaxID=2213046 RepID=UPI00117D6BC5|nr:amidase family protein [Robertkochia solimangrovi]TRZ41813.1 amidase [Robertkochia solimangrovi]
MKRFLLVLGVLTTIAACKEKKEVPVIVYDETAEILKQQDHENPRMRYKLLSSKLDSEPIFDELESELDDFSITDYDRVYPMVFEKTIPEIQTAIETGKLTYKELTLFYLYRIHEYELDPSTSLHAIIKLNGNVVKEAEERDEQRLKNPNHHPIFGMPVLLKDNIGTDGMMTTAGAGVLRHNNAGDAFITERLKENGALILGKLNLSEWAYYFCDGCPVGYSAVGGQTLNPYGRKIFESGGSSSGSGVATAANYAVATVGSETSGSILMPSSINSIVGLKPTIGLLSRTGIVPISSTLDTPGPMTRNVTDNAILLDAMKGEDLNDAASVATSVDFLNVLNSADISEKKFGYFNNLYESDSVYAATIDELKEAGVRVSGFDVPSNVSLKGFLTLLNMDMKYDLPEYLETEAGKDVTVRSVADIIAYNNQDSLNLAPYGQGRFDAIIADTTKLVELEVIKRQLKENGKRFFDVELDSLGFDAVLSMNNYHAAQAAVAQYPAITLPMGYDVNGQPHGLTLIAKPFEEASLLQYAYVVEQLLQARKPPVDYK